MHRQIKYIDKFVEVTVNFKIYSFYFGELKVACFDIFSLCGTQLQSLFLTTAQLCTQYFFP